MPRTAGNAANLSTAPGNIELVAQRVEEVKDLSDVLRGHEVIVDAMGWTSHWEANGEPEYDMALNLASHLAVIRAMPQARPRLLVYLGSRYQYGRVASGPISETEPLTPVDVQGIHKAAAEHHYRLAAERNDLAVISLRFGNTFGAAMPLVGSDVGLIGDMIRKALAGGTIKVFGQARRRTVHYALDLAHFVGRLASFQQRGFLPINVPGEDVAIVELAQQIQGLGGGTITVEALPPDVAAIDVGNAPLDCGRFETHFGPPQLTPLPAALATTIADARERLAAPR